MYRNTFISSVILLFAVVVGFSSGQEECPDDEVHVDCMELCNTCEFRKIVCPRICIPGCDCPPGYLRNRFGQCVPRQFCNGTTAPVSDDDGTDEDAPESGSCDSDDEDAAESGGCPDRSKCLSSCRRRGFRGGRCVGAGRRCCRCGRRREEGDETGVDKPETASSGGCPNRIDCFLSCRRNGFRTGSCIGRYRLICRCHNVCFPRDRFCDDGGEGELGCRRKRCRSSCRRRGFDGGFCSFDRCICE